MTRGVFVPPIITRCLLSHYIYWEEIFQIILLSLDMSAQPSVSRSNDDAPMLRLPQSSLSHVSNGDQKYSSVSRPIRATCEKPFYQYDSLFLLFTHFTAGIWTSPTSMCKSKTERDTK